jgi:hypothetical protein
VLRTANAPPIKYPNKFFPNRKMNKSMSIASVKMPIIGPRMKALGEMDFISAQIRPARQISPFSFHTCRKEINNQTLIKESNIPDNGIFRL